MVHSTKAQAYCLYQWTEKEGGDWVNLLVFFFFSSLSTSCTLYMSIPRHTGHFLKCLWALPDTKHRKGESSVLSFVDPRHTGHFLIASGHCQTLSTERGSLQFIFHVLHFYTCGIFRNYYKE